MIFFKKNWHLEKLVVYGVIFSATLRLLFGIPSIHIVIIAFVLVLGVLVSKKRIHKGLFILLVGIISNLLLNWSDWRPIHSVFTSAYCLIVYYSFQLSSVELERYISALFDTLPIMIVGLIINLYIDKDIFGLIANDIYANEELVFDERFTQRGISFISSPQLLSFYFTILLLLSLARNRIFYISMSLVGGVLTGSKFFFIAIVCSLYVYRKKIRNYWILFVPMVILLTYSTSLSSRVLNFIIESGPLNVQNYSAFVVWMEALATMEKDYVSILFGSNLFGETSRIVQETTKSLVYGSTESSLLSVLLDGGLLIFVIVWRIFFRGILGNNDYVKVACLLVLINFVFTPALYSSIGPLLAIPTINYLKNGFNRSFTLL